MSKKLVSYRIIWQGWQNPASGRDIIEVQYDDGSIDQEAHHPSSWWWNEERFRKAKVLPAIVQENI